MDTIDVTAAVIERGGKFLIARRKPEQHLGGKWEFPGGKRKPGETPEGCLARELDEEFEIITEIGERIAENSFDYPEKDRTVHLLAYATKYISGEFRLNAHDKIAWISPGEFDSYDFAPADLPIIGEIKRRILKK